MTPDVKNLLEFYKSPLGRIVQPLLLRRIERLAGNVKAKKVLGIGFATPYLDFSLKSAELTIALMASRQGVIRWPSQEKSITVLCDLLEMPIPDASIDLIIAVHAFEHISDSEELMREIWRIGAPNAELIVIVPRRRGLWAQIDNTPFGCGNPFSRPQLERLLREHSFEPQKWENALYLIPSQSPLILQSRRIIENIAPLFGATFAGAMCVKAKKQLYPAIARRKKKKILVTMPILKPQTARVK